MTMKPAEIITARKILGMTQERLAYHLGINRVTLADWERGRSSPPPYLGLALAAIRDGLEPI